MKKIRHYNSQAFQFHEKVVLSKKNTQKDPTYKVRIGSLTDKVRERFLVYDEKFENDSLAELSSICNELTPQEINDLLALYSYKAKPFQELNKYLTTLDNGRKQPTCPMCTIGSSNTLDHQIPKRAFPEFSDNPFNLIPCCSQCNSKKGEVWKIGNDRKFLNLYLDDMPDVQYLFVETTLDNNNIKTRFYIDNRNDIENNIYQRIHNHYEVLGLCKRFSENADNVITELKNILIPLRDNIERFQLQNNVINAEISNREYFGFNYWKSLLKIECCTNDGVFNFLLQNHIL